MKGGRIIRERDLCREAAAPIIKRGQEIRAEHYIPFLLSVWPAYGGVAFLRRFYSGEGAAERVEALRRHWGLCKSGGLVQGK